MFFTPGISLSELFRDPELEFDATASAASRISLEVNMASVLNEHVNVATLVVVTVVEWQ
jgi:hypothetical protein